jgi:hypothetical protein
LLALLAEHGRVVADPAAGQQLAVPVGQGDVVVVLSSVDAAEHIHGQPVLLSESLVLFVLV